MATKTARKTPPRKRKATPPKPKGRPTDCTPTITARVTAALRTSGNITLAAQHGPISVRSYHNWRARGEADLADLATQLGVDPEDLVGGEYTATDWPYVHFLHETRKARNDFQLHLLTLIRKAGEGQQAVKKTTKKVTGPDGTVTTEETTTTEVRHWQANAWLLERTLPTEYARVSRHEVTGADGGPLEVTEPAILRAKAEEILAEVAGRLAEGPD